MAQLTKKDFNELARMLGAHKAQLYNTAGSTVALQERGAFYQLQLDIILMCKRSNPRFDSETFKAAVERECNDRLQRNT